MPNIYDKGDLVRITAAFTSAGEPVDPTTVKFKYRVGSAAEVVWTYGTDPQVARSDVGSYYVDFTVSGSGGRISYRWESTGLGQAAAEDYLLVRASEF